jgi:uncharacterized cupin superfamily protein
LRGHAETTALNVIITGKKEEIMNEIKIERNPSPERIRELGVGDWPVWSKEASEFPWSYDAEETCYFLDGEVTVTPEGGESVMVGKGDLVIFPRGMSCTWKIHSGVRKHYTFG